MFEANPTAEMKTRDSNSSVKPVPCSNCEGGIAVPVKGIAPPGSVVKEETSLFKCHWLFCSNSIWNHDGPTGEGSLLTVQKEMAETAKEYKQ